jgi:methionyl-tRNA formyltransferase
VFCGTPRFAVPTLEGLAEAGFRISLVVTQPDQRRGRGLDLAASPVKQSALELGFEIAQPETIKNNQGFQQQLGLLAPRAIVVVGYGRILPQWMIALPEWGNINLHASLLPKYRGAAPIQWALANGETSSGVTTMRIDAGLDTGDILLQQEVAIDPDDTAPSFAAKLAPIGASLVVDSLRRLETGSLAPRPQDHSQATSAPILNKENGRIDFHRSAQAICNQLRGFDPWPGAFTGFRGKTLHIRRARPSPLQLKLAAGESALAGDQWTVGCGDDTSVELLEVQLEGKKRMPAADFVHGYRLGAGERLGQ